jgi:hypothetical protein
MWLVRFFIRTEIANACLRNPRKDRHIDTSSDEEDGSQERLIRHAAGVRRDTGIPRKENWTIRIR